MRTLIIIHSSLRLQELESNSIGPTYRGGSRQWEIRCYRRLLHIFYNDHISTKIHEAIGPYEDLLSPATNRTYIMMVWTGDQIKWPL